MTKANDTKELTYLAVKNLIKKKEIGVYPDGGIHRGLRLTITARSVSYIFRYTNVNKQLKQIKLGSADPDKGLSLSEARSMVAEYKAMRSKGIDPLQQAKEEKEKLKASLAQTKQDHYTVSMLMQDYINESICNRNLKGQTEAVRLIKKDVVSKFGRLSAHKLTKAMIHDHMHHIMKTRKITVQAGYMVREISAAYEHAFSADRLPDNMRNPCQGIKRPTSSKRSRYLSDDEIVTFYNWLPDSKLSYNAKNVLILTLLTGCRSGELCALNWNDVNLTKGIITLNITKTDVPRNVMLSTQAIFILKRIKDKSVSQWVFPSNRPPQKAINQHSVNLQVNYNREYSGVEDWSAHDLRRTCRTHLSKLQCPSDIAEAVLGHTVGGVKGHYDLYKYEPEQKKWLQTWADHIDGLVTSAKEVENVKRAN